MEKIIAKCMVGLLYGFSALGFLTVIIDPTWLPFIIGSLLFVIARLFHNDIINDEYRERQRKLEQEQKTGHNN